jgi:hypothetical protein
MEQEVLKKLRFKDGLATVLNAPVGYDFGIGDLNRDLLAARVREQTPYRVVSNVAIDDKWSALRFRHEDKVKTGK